MHSASTPYGHRDRCRFRGAVVPARQPARFRLSHRDLCAMDGRYRAEMPPDGIAVTRNAIGCGTCGSQPAWAAPCATWFHYSPRPEPARRRRSVRVAHCERRTSLTASAVCWHAGQWASPLRSCWRQDGRRGGRSRNRRLPDDAVTDGGGGADMRRASNRRSNLDVIDRLGTDRRLRTEQVVLAHRRSPRTARGRPLLPMSGWLIKG